MNESNYIRQAKAEPHYADAPAFVHATVLEPHLNVPPPPVNSRVANAGAIC